MIKTLKLYIYGNFFKIQSSSTKISLANIIFTFGKLNAFYLYLQKKVSISTLGSVTQYHTKTFPL